MLWLAFSSLMGISKAPCDSVSFTKQAQKQTPKLEGEFFGYVTLTLRDHMDCPALPGPTPTPWAPGVPLPEALARPLSPGPV